MVTYFVVDSDKKVLFETRDLKTAKEYAHVYLAEQAKAGSVRIQFEDDDGWKQFVVGKQAKNRKAGRKRRDAGAYQSPARRRALLIANAAAASLVLMVLLIAVKEVVAG